MGGVHPGKLGGAQLEGVQRERRARGVCQEWLLEQRLRLGSGSREPAEQAHRREENCNPLPHPTAPLLFFAPSANPRYAAKDCPPIPPRRGVVPAGDPTAERQAAAIPDR
jgi:hypothetical protein